MTDYHTLVEKLSDSKFISVNPHEVARVIAGIATAGDYRALGRLRKSYLDSLMKSGHDAQEATALVDENLFCASVLADMVDECGYEASGQLFGVNGMIRKGRFGKSATFYSGAIGYKPRA